MVDNRQIFISSSRENQFLGLNSINCLKVSIRLVWNANDPSIKEIKRSTTTGVGSNYRLVWFTLKVSLPANFITLFQLLLLCYVENWMLLLLKLVCFFLLILVSFPASLKITHFKQLLCCIFKYDSYYNEHGINICSYC